MNDGIRLDCFSSYYDWLLCVNLIIPSVVKIISICLKKWLTELSSITSK